MIQRDISPPYARSDSVEMNKGKAESGKSPLSGVLKAKRS